MKSATAHPEELLFEPELVVRGSTGPAPVSAAAENPDNRGNGAVRPSCPIAAAVRGCALTSYRPAKIMPCGSNDGPVSGTAVMAPVQGFSVPR